MLFNIADLAPSVLPIIDNKTQGGGGASSRGSHRLADVTNCPRKWYMRYVKHCTRKGEPEFRLMGTLIHSALANYYAAMLPEEQQPDWFKEMPLYHRLTQEAGGKIALADRAFETGEQYIEWTKKKKCDWIPYSVENEYQATLGELDPDGEDAPGFELEFRTPSGEPSRMIFPTLNEEVVTCRTDLIVTKKTNNTMWVVDHKSKTPEYHEEKFGKWNDNGEFALDWQVLVNLMVIRARGIPVRGFIVQRVKRDGEFDADRHPVPVPVKAYEGAPGLARHQIKVERQHYRNLAQGISPVANYFNCYGRWGECDYRPICRADNAEDQARIINTLYNRP